MRKLFKTVLFLLSVPFLVVRNWIIKRLLKLRAKLQIGSLRLAIDDADKDKENTGRKNMVVFNSHSGKFEPIQKKVLKAASKSGKNKSNKAMTEGRVRMMKPKKKRYIDVNRVHQIEEKSLYVTK